MTTRVGTQTNLVVNIHITLYLNNSEQRHARRLNFIRPGVHKLFWLADDLNCLRYLL